MFLLGSTEHVWLVVRELVVHNNATPPLHNPSSSQVSTMSQMDRYTRLVGVERTIQQICLCNSTITSATLTPCDVMSGAPTVRTRWAEDWSGIEPRTSRPNAKRSGLVHSLLHPLARSLTWRHGKVTAATRPHTIILLFPSSHYL